MGYMTDYVKFQNNFILALLVAKGFESETGPMSGENPLVEEGDDIDDDAIYLTLSSQCGDTMYRFNLDGSVDEIWDWYDEDDAVEELVDVGFEEEDAREYYREGPYHYKTVLDLLDECDRTTWFMYFEDEHPELYNMIKTFVDLIRKGEK